MPHNALIDFKFFADVQWYTNARFGKGHGTPNLTNWRCFGNETSLAQCLHQNASYSCYHSRDVGVSCQGEEVKGFLNTLFTSKEIYKFLVFIIQYQTKVLGHPYFKYIITLNLQTGYFQVYIFLKGILYYINYVYLHMKPIDTMCKLCYG